MKRFSPSFALAFCFSLSIASTALLLLDRQAQTSLGWIQWSAVRRQYAVYEPATGYVRVPIKLPRPSNVPTPKDVPTPKNVPAAEPPEPIVQLPPVDSFLEQLGDHAGDGVGINAAPGEKPMESPFADPEHQHEQPMLSRDPQGAGPLLTTPAPSQLVRGQNGGGGTGMIKPRPQAHEQAMKPPQIHNPTPKAKSAPPQPQPPRPQPQPQPVAQAMPPVAPPKAAPQPKPAPVPAPEKISPPATPPVADTLIAIGPTPPKPSTTKPVPARAEAEKPKAKPTPKNAAIASAKPADDPNRKLATAELPATRPAVAAKPVPPAAVPPAAPPVTVAMANMPAGADLPTSPPEPAEAGNSAPPGVPGPDAAPADPAPQSDMESFALVAKNPNLRLVPGATKAQFGRRWKPKELPRLDVAAWDHIRMTLDDLYVVLELRTDADGNVTRVRVVHSAGIDAIDMPCQRAAYTWWFEPPVDRNTKQPQSDVFLFSIVFF